jgi:SAM-dependent methyltransferase
MRNPWLDIPEVDYVGHMSSPLVNQRPVLNRLLRDALESVRPRTVLVLGCSTGNGLEHVNPKVTSRVTVVDVNPGYLLRLVERFPNPGFEVDVRCADLADFVFEPVAFDLVHAGLVLEYVEWPSLLPGLAATLRPRGVLSVVLQRPSASSPAVTPTAFTSLRSLESLFRFVEPDALVEAARGAGLTLNNRYTESLTSGKAFEVLRFVKNAVDSPGRHSTNRQGRVGAKRRRVRKGATQ